MVKLNGVQTLDMVNGEITKVAYGGAEYAKVADDFNTAQTGDIFLHTGNGAYYEITIRDSYFCGIHHPVRFITNGGRESGFMRGCSIHPLFRKVSESSPTLVERVSALESEVSALKGEMATSEEIITFEGAEYRKVDREARAGDVVIFRANTYRGLTNGIPYLVEDSGGTLTVNNYTFLYLPKYGRTCETVDVYELVAKEQAPKFVVGDYVKVVKSELGNEGKIVQITDDSDGQQMRKANGDVVDADYVGIPVGDTEVYGFTEDQLVEATAEEIADANKPKLKAGDFVKFKRSIADTKAGKPYLIEYYETAGELAFKDDAGDWCMIARSGEYEIVDAETAKWAKVRRNVGEFRVGDIARVIEDVCGKKVGKIFEVKRVNKFIVVCDEGYRYDVGKHVELITPVDARFDK